MSELPFANRLKVLIGEKNISEFARLSGVGESALRKYLGGSKPGLDALVQITDATGASIEWLAKGKGSPYLVERITDITPEIAQNLDMKEQYVRAVFVRLYDLQRENEVQLPTESFWFAIAMLNQFMIDKFGGKEASEEEIEQVLTDYVDKLVGKADWKS